MGNGQLSQATRVHYTAVNPYKELQSIISKDKFQVPQLSSKKTTGYSFGLSVERVLETSQDESNEYGGKKSSPLVVKKQPLSRRES